MGSVSAYTSQNMSHPKDGRSMEVAPLFPLDYDFHGDSTPKHNSEMELDNLLSVDQLLESVMDSAQQVGRMSICNPHNVSYMEMTNHCEDFTLGKHTKMSNLMSIQQRQVFRNSGDQNKQTDGNHFMEQNGAPATSKRVPTCTTEHQNVPQSFRLPASSPYDNFLKAAGC